MASNVIIESDSDDCDINTPYGCGCCTGGLKWYVFGTDLHTEVVFVGKTDRKEFGFIKTENYVEPIWGRRRRIIKGILTTGYHGYCLLKEGQTFETAIKRPHPEQFFCPHSIDYRFIIEQIIEDCDKYDRYY